MISGARAQLRLGDEVRAGGGRAGDRTRGAGRVSSPTRTSATVSPARSAERSATRASWRTSDPSTRAFLSYHLPDNSLDPLINDLAIETARWLEVSRGVVHKIDGTRTAPGCRALAPGRGGLQRGWRSQVVSALAVPTEYGLDADSYLERGADGGWEVHGTLFVEGPDEDGRRGSSWSWPRRACSTPGRARSSCTAWSRAAR